MFAERNSFKKNGSTVENIRKGNIEQYIGQEEFNFSKVRKIEW